MFKNFATMVSPPKGTTPSNQLDGNKDPSNQQSKSDTPRDGTFPNAGVVGLSFLVLLADFLFWGYRLGITLGLFALAIFAVAALHRKPQTGVIKPALLMGFATLPIFEHVQTLSVVILVLGTLGALVWIRAPKDGRFTWIISAAAKLAACLPFGGLTACAAALGKVRDQSTPPTVFDHLRSKTFWFKWSLPVGGSLILGALLMSANPVLESVVLRVFQIDLNIVKTAPRIMFWGGISLLIWPLLNPPKPQDTISMSLPRLDRKFGVNGGSVLRSLIVFNVILGVQSMLDFSILLGNAALPDGMTYATYAHRGAYSLMITAMLAGIFAIAARPYLKEHAVLKPLLVLWIGQNTLLSFSAVLRLNLYIGEYGLTYLRTYALIWIGLVGLGLVLVLWHVLRERSSYLLIARLAAIGFGTLYLSAFFNFAGFIARSTITQATDTASVDWSYLCQLGPTAQKAVIHGLAANSAIVAPAGFHRCFVAGDGPYNWRETGFRSIRSQLPAPPN
ncbi:protein of unknown function [Octadecabacter temperatus]|uniref:Uncharacterized protein n=1 Tax=Octadecabacter temperatus TaxID=1458307 RepID=A0A0K0Y2Q4_9RHOB|nr:DUF4173 domain-containing protein [Octadecabacter temperatus]AKS45197.1 hypothetical protein OSB_06360 [Octadecabacter temperatus]SIN88080.1 protein of unknown function [Octadecabacter temperatus]